MKGNLQFLIVKHSVLDEIVCFIPVLLHASYHLIHISIAGYEQQPAEGNNIGDDRQNSARRADDAAPRLFL